MGKVNVADFKTEVCMGEDARFDGPCPHRMPVGEDNDKAVVDTLARAEGAALNVLSRANGESPSDFKCGMCSCPLVNLAVADVAPANCPRLAAMNE